MWEGLDPDLKSMVVRGLLAALTFASVLGALVAKKLYAYVEIIADAKIEEARATSTKRLALAGELASASTEEAARASGIKGAEKATVAAEAAAVLLELPAKIDGLKAGDPAVRAAVQAGVAKLRASVPSAYVLTQSQIPAPVDVVATPPLPPPSKLPAFEERPTTAPQRKPRG